MTWNRRTMVLAGWIAAGATLSAQGAVLPIRELVTRVPGFAGTDYENDHPFWVRRLMTRDDQSVRNLLGEHTLLSSHEDDLPLDAGSVAEMVAAVGGFSDAKIEASDDGRLRVHGDVAGAATDALAWLRQSLRPAVELDVRLLRVTDAGHEVVLSSRGAAQFGEVLRLLDAQPVDHVTSYSVEIASGSVIADPVVRTVVCGGGLLLRPWLSPGGDGVLVEAVLRDSHQAEAEPIRSGHAAFGSWRRPALRVNDAGFALRLVAGQPGTVEWTSASGEQLQLSLLARFIGPRPTPRADAVAVASGLLAKGPQHFASLVDRPGAEASDWQARDLPIALEAVEPLVGSLSVRTLSYEDAGVRLFLGEDAQAAAKLVLTAVRRSLSSAELSIEVLDAPRGADLEGGADAAVRRLAAVRAPVLRGASVAFSGERELCYLRDWDCEVATSARTPSPVVGVARSGYAVSARLLERAVDLRLELASPPEIAARETAMSTAMDVPEVLRVTGGKDRAARAHHTPPARLPADRVVLESVQQGRFRIATRVALVDGAATLRHAAPRLLGPGRELIVRVQAR